jgi:predicted ATPase
VDLPAGTVTVLLTDIEGSTRLIAELGEERYLQALAEHRRLLRAAFAAHGGVEVDTQGDAFLFAFADPVEAVAAAADGQKALASGPVTVRMGLHTGELQLTGEGYAGRELHRAARIAASGHGGQVVVSAATQAFVDGQLIELGEHRLKDFDEPVALFQLGAQRFPPLKTISNTNLPRPVSSFVGRHGEREELVSMLSDGTRLLTLSGPGGSGKTRLAIEAASELVPAFKAGVYWVGLSALRDPALVTQAIAQIVGAKDDLAAHISERELLLLLDNFEQVVEAAPELSQLLETCPNLRLLVTSRELLRIRGEVEYPVSPLAEPDAVELFCERARHEPDETIAELCRRLDDMPLALELAAARTSVLTPEQILDRLAQRLDLFKGSRDADPRQQTLRATIEWSHDLLDQAEQQLFARLAVFAGGCTLAAAEEVCEADLDVLQSLVEKSLLRHTGDRFWMLETIREYGVERLEGSDEASTLHCRHAEFFLSFVEEAEPNLIGAGSRARWLDPLEREHENVRRAIAWFEASGENDRALRLVAALWRFWDLKGHLIEGRHRLESALRADEHPTAARAKALAGAADMALTSGDGATGGRRAREALELYEALGDAWGTAFSRLMVAYAMGLEGDWPGAQHLFGKSVREFRELGDSHYALRAARAHAWAYYEGGDLARARQLNEEIVSLAREAHDPLPQGIALDGLAGIALDQGRLDDAVRLVEESYRIFRDLDDLLLVGQSVCRCAQVLALAGKPEIAARVLSGATALLDEIGAMPPYVAANNAQTLDVVRLALDEIAFADAWEQGRTLTPEEAVTLTLDSLA